MSKPLQIIALLAFCQISVSAPATERKMTPEEYIKNFNEVAVKEMLMYDIPASITLAQGMLESNYGNSDLAVYANNHFGIKCHEKWDGQTYIKDDDQKDECFRKYPSVLDSYSDHSKFLKLQTRYGTLFELKRNDYKGWAKGLKEIGYATDPQYTQRLLHLIEAYKLYEYDNVDGRKKARAPDNGKVKLYKYNNQNSEQNAITSDHGKSSVSKTIQTREILRFHYIKYIIVNPGDSFSKIALDTDKDLWQLYKFNDLTANDSVQLFL